MRKPWIETSIASELRSLQHQITALTKRVEALEKSKAAQGERDGFRAIGDALSDLRRGR